MPHLPEVINSMPHPRQFDIAGRYEAGPTEWSRVSESNRRHPHYKGGTLAN